MSAGTPLAVPAPERKWALTRVAAGDYLLPSNDGRSLWRISQYEESGDVEVSADGKTWRKFRGMFWLTAKYRRPLNPSAGVQLPPDFLEWEHWETWDTCLLRRADAVDVVVKRG